MKKFIAILITAAISVSSMFAGFFSNRIFEIVLDAPASVTNNSIAIMDVLQENVVIDLNEFARKMPNDGLQFTVWTDPSVAVNLDIKILQLGLKAGTDVYGMVGVSKDIFDVLCNGNEIGQDINVRGVVNADAFAYVESSVGFKLFRKFGVKVTPALFVPVIHVVSDEAGATITNTENGDVIMDLNGTLNMHTLIDYNQGYDEVTAKAFSSMGFDIAGELSYSPFKLLNLTGYMRMPIVPGNLGYLSKRDFNMYYETNLSYIMDGKTSEKNTDFSLSDGDFVESEYLINRPFKMNVRADFQLLPKLLTTSAGLGFGVRNPFNETEAKFYPEYYLGTRLSFFDILAVNVSSEYTNCVYIQEVAGTASIRFVQVDLGASLQSPSFANCFSLAGLGAFARFTIGF